jgi:hypothetical protein
MGWGVVGEGSKQILPHFRTDPPHTTYFSKKYDYKTTQFTAYRKRSEVSVSNVP